MAKKIPPSLGVVYMQKLMKKRDSRVRELQRLRSAGRTLIFLSVLTLAVTAALILAFLPNFS